MRNETFIFRDSQITEKVDNYEQILIDIHFLSNADYLVCTFSSNLCRLAYELMQTRTNEQVDYSNRVKSLDTQYHFNADMKSWIQAIMSNSPIQDDSMYKVPSPCNTKNEGGSLEFENGDVIETYIYQGLIYDGYYQNGCMYGRNNRTNQKGYFSSYKAVKFFG